jgi:dTDP-4-amino-4,6-dideoxygalactose transaminase
MSAARVGSLPSGQDTAMEVPYLDLRAQYAELREEVLAALDRVCQNAAFILGEEVEAFERDFAAYCGAKYCVALNSGTSALHLALLAIGVGPGHEVITTPNSFVATAEAISYTGATPVFVDIDAATANLDPQRVAAAITPRTRALLPVHLYGRPADLERLGGIARRHNLALVEDACQAHGARYRGQPVGSFSRAAAFSFYPSKNLGAYGEGGALTTNDALIAQLAHSLRDHGQGSRYSHERIGWNYRMDGFQGAVLRVKLKRLDGWVARRRELAQLYRRRLACARVTMPQDDPRDECSYPLFVVYLDNRDGVRAQLEARGIHTAVHYFCPIHLQKAYAPLGYRPGSLPHAELACRRALSLPIYPEMTNAQAEYVARVLAETVGTQLAGEK